MNIVLIALINAFFFFIMHWGPLELAENKTFDLRAKMFAEKAHDDIVIITVDDESIIHLTPTEGPWPWSRKVYVDMLDYLSRAKVKAVLFDIFFAGRNNGDDLQLAGETIKNGRVFHGMFLYDAMQFIRPRSIPLGFIKKFAFKDIVQNRESSDTSYDFEIPFEELYEAAYGVGVLNVEPDSDGVYRKISFFKKYEKDRFPTLPFSMLIKLNQTKKVEEYNDKVNFVNADGGSTEIPKQEDNKYLIKHCGSFKTIPIKDILFTIRSSYANKLRGKFIPPSALENKIVIVGVSANEGNDFGSTPLVKKQPGVFIHASVISNILSNDFLKRKNDKETFFYMLILSYVIYILGFFFKAKLFKVGIPLLFCGVIVFLWFYLFRYNLVYQLVVPSLDMIVVSAMINCRVQSNGYLIK